jgi:signal-transduction protein with cAMP-binding, CBS, and nucleotidyltransferase domain
MTATPTPAVTRVDELRLRPAVTVSPDAPIDQVARIMRAHNVSALVVGRAGDPVAIVTERDLTQALADGCPADERVVAIASPDPKTVAHDATVIEVATLMLSEGLRHLVVAKQHRVVGIISIRDALAALVTAVTPDTVFIRLERITIDASENWLG